MQKLLTIIAGVGGIYYLVVASRLLTFFGIFIPPQQHRAISLSLALILIFLLGSTHVASAKKRAVHWYDVVLLVAGLLGLVVVHHLLTLVPHHAAVLHTLHRHGIGAGVLLIGRRRRGLTGLGLRGRTPTSDRNLPGP